MENNENLDSRTKRFREEYQGKHFFTKDGEEEFIIKDARTYGDVDIEFIGSGIIKNTKVGNIKNGLPNPFTKAGIHGKPGPVAFDSFQQQYNGCIFPTNYDGNIQITNYIGRSEVYYRFLDETGYQGCTTIQNIKNGQVKNPFRRNACGGYLGIGVYNGLKYKYIHALWYAMLTRATGQRARYAANCNSYMNVKSYENLLLDPEWFCYNSFANWYMDIFSRLNTKDYIYNVDKDLLFPYYRKFTGDRKCYSKYTCILLPRHINIEIANYESCKNYNKPKLKQSLKDICEAATQNGALDLDTYNVIKRFYLEDPEYSNYVSERCKYMSYILNFANFDPAADYKNLSRIAPLNI